MLVHYIEIKVIGAGKPDRFIHRAGSADFIIRFSQQQLQQLRAVFMIVHTKNSTFDFGHTKPPGRATLNYFSSEEFRRADYNAVHGERATLRCANRISVRSPTVREGNYGTESLLTRGLLTPCNVLLSPIAPVAIHPAPPISADWLAIGRIVRLGEIHLLRIFLKASDLIRGVDQVCFLVFVAR